MKDRLKSDCGSADSVMHKDTRKRFATVEVKHGPLQVRENCGQGVNAELGLDHEIIAHEYFPTDVTVDFYTLTLRRAVYSIDDIPQAANNLTEALHRLCYVWPFAAESPIFFEATRTRRILLYRDNF